MFSQNIKKKKKSIVNSNIIYVVLNINIFKFYLDLLHKLFKKIKYQINKY